MPTITPPKPADLAAALESTSPATIALSVLDEQIDEFSKDLNDDESVELSSVSAPGGPSFFIQERSAVSRKMILLKGFDINGRPIAVVQHYSQMNIMLSVIDKNAAGRRYGFIHPDDLF